MAGYRRLSERTGSRDESGPHEGVPPHLVAHLIGWIRQALNSRQTGYPEERLVALVVVRLEVPVPINSDKHQQVNVLLHEAANDPELLLDCLDLLLNLERGSADRLSMDLRLGGSVWTVAGDGKSLERRVSDEERAATQAVVEPSDVVANEIATAWASAFGVRPDPSDAWDHAIKALEALLIPVVVPNQTNATLGHVVGAIKTDSSRWTIDLQTNGDLTDGQTLLGLLQLVWANPDRHANANQRTPSLAEAEKIVKVAVLIIGLCRNGQLRKLP